MSNLIKPGIAHSHSLIGLTRKLSYHFKVHEIYKKTNKIIKKYCS